ncbi:MAG: TonB-dependent receptor, partial [Muribaculaceae bacterium]|nr:TonB-dependent receptor [Muribaculaceae bacterium]
DNVVIPYRQTTAKAAPYFKGSIIKWLSLNYEADYTFSTLTIQDSSSSCHSFWQSLFLTFLPSDKIQLSIGSEHFLTRFPEKNTANLILLDASAIWRLSNRIRLSLTGSNLLNRRRYEYQTYGTLSRSEHSFRIRGRNILLGIQYSF